MRWHAVGGGGFLLIALVALALAVLPAAASAKGAAAGLGRSFGENGRAASGFAFTGSGPEYGMPTGWENANVDVIAGPAGFQRGRRQASDRSSHRQRQARDSSFGEGGRLTPTTLAGLAFKLDSVVVDSQGRLLAFGTGEDLGVTKLRGSASESLSSVGVHPSYAVGARYTTGGGLDPSFGGGVDGQDRPLAFAYGDRLGSSRYSAAFLPDGEHPPRPPGRTAESPRAVVAGGKLLVADPGLSPKLPNGGLFLARYRLGS